MSKTEIVPIIVSAVGVLIPLVLLMCPAVVHRRRLARIYPDRPFVAEKTYRSIGGMSGSAYYGACYLGGNGSLTVELGATGLRFSSWPLLQRWFPTVVIPWSKIMLCVLEEHFLGAPSVKLEFSDWRYSISLRGNRWRDESLAVDLVAYWRSGREIINPSPTKIPSSLVIHSQVSA